MWDKGILQELMTKFCHDMAGAINITGNGVELAQSLDDPKAVAEALQIAQKGSGKSYATLRLFRDIIFAEELPDMESAKEILADYANCYDIKSELDFNQDDLKENAKNLVMG